MVSPHTDADSDGLCDECKLELDVDGGTEGIWIYVCIAAVAVTACGTVTALIILKKRKGATR